jgi:hypothetical protein
MNYIKDYSSFKLNEEFIGSLVTGALSKIFQAFSSPFKNIATDIKSSFKDGDPNSIKNIVMGELNKGIDNIQKLMRDKSTDPSGIMDQFITKVTELANGLDKDFDTAIKDKKMASGSKQIAKAILIGNKEANWKGIVGILLDTNYKYSKQKYGEILAKAGGGKTGVDGLNQKQDAAFKFFEEMQKDLEAQISKELTEEEMTKIYDETIKKLGGSIPKYTYEQIKEFFDKKSKVMYKMEGYDDKIDPKNQQDKIGTKLISKLDDQGNVTFQDSDGKEFQKKYIDIIGPAKSDTQNVATEITNDLKNIKSDPNKLSVVKDFTTFLSTATKDKIAQVEKIIKPNEQERGEDIQ